MQIARMPGVRVAFPRQDGDRHRAFTLTVDLNEFLAERVEPASDVFQVHRPTGINDCFQILEFRRPGAGMVDEALDDGGRTEDRRAPMDFEQLKNLRRVELAALGDDLSGGLRDMREN